MGKKKGSYKQRKKERIQYLINEEKKEEEQKLTKRAKRKERQMDVDDLDVNMFSSRKRRKYESENNKVTKVNKPKKASEIMEVDIKSSEPKPKSVVMSLGFDELKQHKELIEETKGKTMKRKRSNSIKQGKFMSNIGVMEVE